MKSWNTPRRLLLAGLTALLTVPALAAQEDGGRVRPWDDDTLDLARHIAIQEHGRIKPLDTAASFLLLRTNGKRVVRLEDGKLSPIEWYLDCLLFPEQARHYPVFSVNSWEVVEAIGLDITGKKKRDRYSYDEISRGESELERLGRQFGQREEKDRTAIENQVVNLFQNYVAVHHLLHALEFARATYPLDGSPGLKRVFEGVEGQGLSALLSRVPELFEFVQSMPQGHDGGDESAALRALISEAESRTFNSFGLTVFPPVDTDPLTPWLSPTDLFQSSFRGQGEGPAEEHLGMLAALEDLVRNRDDSAGFSAALTDFQTRNQDLAQRRGEYEKVSLEVTFYKGQFFYYSLLLYGLSFLLVAISWLLPRARALRWAIWITLIPPTILATTGIVMRCMIRERPPVSTLYETILFVTVCAVLSCMVIEWINRQKVGLAMAATLGFAGMFLANKFEMLRAEDTMPQLVAVLDTNFWLATHVTTITIGYSAGLLAGFLAHIYLLGKVFGYKKGNRAFYSSVARMVYGVLCFALLFSVVGTILGGVWANDSWGRFWGWDPKENGALMICLSQLAILHARMGGLLKDFGVCVAAVAGNTIVAFSWWGVNLLGVGLHSYGFTAGIQRALWGFYGLEGLVVATAGIWWMATQGKQGSSPQSKGPSPAKA